MNRRNSFNVMISASGRRVALLQAFRSALRALDLGGRLCAADCSPLSAAFHKADAGFIVPKCLEPGFIPAMTEICRQEGISLLVPTIDPELPILSKARCELNAVGATVHVSEPECVAIGGDKLLTHDWLCAHGVPTVDQWSAHEVPCNAAFPLVAKPRFGSASIGVQRISSEQELDTIRETPDLLIQEIAPGYEHTVDVFVDRSGRCKCAVPRRRLEVRAGEVSKGVTVRNEALEQLATQVAEALPGARGVLNIQVFVDPGNGRMSVIEINPRFGGGVPLSVAAGADFPRWVVEDTLGLPCEADQGCWREGVVMLRWDDAVFTKAEKLGLRL